MAKFYEIISTTIGTVSLCTLLWACEVPKTQKTGNSGPSETDLLRIELSRSKEMLSRLHSIEGKIWTIFGISFQDYDEEYVKNACEEVGFRRPTLEEGRIARKQTTDETFKKELEEDPFLDFRDEEETRRAEGEKFGAVRNTRGIGICIAK